MLSSDPDEVLANDRQTVPIDGPASLPLGHRPDHDAPIPVITMPIFLITIDRSW
jgi:hypothetical protein